VNRDSASCWAGAGAIRGAGDFFAQKQNSFTHSPAIRARLAGGFPGGGSSTGQVAFQQKNAPFGRAGEKLLAKMFLIRPWPPELNSPWLPPGRRSINKLLSTVGRVEIFGSARSPAENAQIRLPVRAGEMIFSTVEFPGGDRLWLAGRTAGLRDLNRHSTERSWVRSAKTEKKLGPAKSRGGARTLENFGQRHPPVDDRGARKVAGVGGSIYKNPAPEAAVARCPSNTG